MSLDEYLDRARREVIPMIKQSTISAIIYGEPDPKLCLELGACILLEKPLLVIVPKGRTLPLSLRTIATKIVEIDGISAADGEKIQAAVEELMETLPFRGRGLASAPGDEQVKP